MKCLAAVVLACLLPPLVFETAARFAPERSSAWRPGAAVRVLCIGDSNTFGVGVPDEASYPAQLQTLLDENSPGRFSVINLGTPGMATWQIRQRLPAQLARYSPDIVILLAGVNNGWNLRPPGGEPGLRHRIEVVLLHSRLYRLLRVALRDHSLERTAAATRADGRHQVASQRGCDGQGCLTTWEIEHGGVVDVLSHSSNEKRESGDRQQQAFEDIRAMLRLVAGAGARLILVPYPRRVLPFAFSNRAMARARDELGVAMAESWRALERVPIADQEWFGPVHPGAAIYRELAREVHVLVESLAPS